MSAKSLKGAVKRRSRKILYISALLLVGIVLSYLIFEWTLPKKNNGQFPPHFTISKETTVALGPLTESGFVDYAEAINRKLSEGLAAKDNAAIDLMRALGPSVDDSPFGLPHRTSEFKQIWDKLEMGPIPQGDDFFVTVKAFLGTLEAADSLPEMKKYPAETTPGEVADKELESVLASPWKPEEHPLIAKWLKKNETSLNLVKLARKKKSFFIPCKSVPPREASLLYRKYPDDTAEPLLVIPGTVAISKLVEVRKALAAQAMLLLGQGRHEEAWNELLGSHRLAVLISNNGSLIDLIMGVAFDIPIQEAALAFFQEKQIPPEFFKKMIRDLQQLEGYPNPRRAYDLFERYFALSYVMTYNRAGLETALHLYAAFLFTEKMDLPEITEFGGRFFSRRLKKAMAQIQWDPILKQTNDQFDQVVAALELPDRAARRAALKQLQNDREAIRPVTRAAAQQWINYLYHNQYDSGWDLQKSAADFCKSFFADNPINIQNAQDRSEQKWNNLTVAAALEACKREKGAYPAKLGELLPGYLKEIPNDRFSNKELIYRRTANGYLLYSVGADETDDGGKMQKPGEPTGDIGIEMPPQPKPVKAD